MARKRLDPVLAQQGPLRRFALCLTRNPDLADDLVQETLSKALAVIGATTVRQIRPWLFAILHNEWRRQARRTRTTVPLEIDMPDAIPAVEVGFTAQVLRALETLPPDQAAVLRLVAIEELSYAETADILGIPVGTVMSRLNRARARLRMLLEEPKVVSFRRQG